MQAIIMAAGKGSRLGELTRDIPKSFVEIKGKKLIEYNLRLLEKYGIDDIILVTGYHCEAFEKLVRDRNDIHLVFNPFYEMTNVLGSFYIGMEALHDDFIFLHADTLCEPEIFEKLVHMQGDIVLPVEYKRCDEEAMKVRSENGRVIEITKQMSLDVAEGEFIGMAAFQKKVVPALKEKTKQLLKEKEFGAYFESAIQRLIDEEMLKIITVPTGSAFWTEIDYLEDYEDATIRIPESLTTIFEAQEKE